VFKNIGTVVRLDALLTVAVNVCDAKEVIGRFVRPDPFPRNTPVARISPETSKGYAGVVVPIPRLPLLVKTIQLGDPFIPVKKRGATEPVVKLLPDCIYVPPYKVVNRRTADCGSFELPTYNSFKTRQFPFTSRE
jgi:hypothetical protein